MSEIAKCKVLPSSVDELHLMLKHGADDYSMNFGEEGEWIVVSCAMHPTAEEAVQALEKSCWWSQIGLDENPKLSTPNLTVAYVDYREADGEIGWWYSKKQGPHSWPVWSVDTEGFE